MDESSNGRAWPVAARAVAAALGCNLVGILGALSTTTDSAWYRELVKPSFQPPGWVFGPVWTLLYSLMGVAVARIYERRDEPGAKLALAAFGLQLALNAVWSPLFFAAEAIVAALVVIVAMWLMIGVTMWRFARVDRLAAGLLLPYLLWVSFAALLNAAIVQLNG